MKNFEPTQQKESRTLDANPKASRQAPIEVILQKYAARNNTVQRESIPEEEEGLLQGKFEKTPIIQMQGQEIIQLIMQGRKIGDQKGTFIGAPSKTHIHIVGSNTHLIVRGKRYNFDEGVADKRMQNAYDHLIAEGEGTRGFVECREAFERELGIVRTDDKEKRDDSDDDFDDGGGKDDRAKYNRWLRSGGYMKTDRYGIPINSD